MPGGPSTSTNSVDRWDGRASSSAPGTTPGPRGSTEYHPEHGADRRSSPMDPQIVLALCHEHAAAEAEFDTDRVLATLVAEPRYEFYPLARSMSGRANIEHFYR